MQLTFDLAEFAFTVEGPRDRHRQRQKIVHQLRAVQRELKLRMRPRSELGPLGMRPKRGRAVDREEIRALYLQLGDIKRVALHLKIHEKRVRPEVRDLMAHVREQQWSRRRRSVRVRDDNRLVVLEVPYGTRWRCPCCHVLVVVTEEHWEPVCPKGTRAPWLLAENPFTPDERWLTAQRIDLSLPHA